MLLESFPGPLISWYSHDVSELHFWHIDSYFMTPASCCVGLSRFIFLLLLRLSMDFYLLCFVVRLSIIRQNKASPSEGALLSVLLHRLNFSTDVLLWVTFFFFSWQISVLTLSNPWGWRVKGWSSGPEVCLSLRGLREELSQLQRKKNRSHGHHHCTVLTWNKKLTVKKKSYLWWSRLRTSRTGSEQIRMFISSNKKDKK